MHRVRLVLLDFEFNDSSSSRLAENVENAWKEFNCTTWC